MKRRPRANLDGVRVRLALCESLSNQSPKPFAWKFNRDQLAALLARIAADEKLLGGGPFPPARLTRPNPDIICETPLGCIRLKSNGSKKNGGPTVLGSSRRFSQSQAFFVT